MTDLEKRYFTDRRKFIIAVRNALSLYHSQSEEEIEKDKKFMELVDKEFTYDVFYEVVVSSYAYVNGEFSVDNRDDAVAYYKGEKSVDFHDATWDCIDDAGDEIETDRVSASVYNLKLKSPSDEAQAVLDKSAS